MANSLRAKLSKLRHDRNITEEEYQEFIKKLDGHDKQIRTEILKEVECAMHHQAFYVDHELDGLQRWDGGNWIRYKLFENVIEQLKEQK